MLLSIVRPIAKLIGKIHAPFSHKLVDALDYEQILARSLPGDILLTHTSGEFTNLFILGFWKHSAIVGVNGAVIEAVGEGVKRTHFFDFLRGKDYVSLVRLPVTERVRTDAASWATKYLGSGYDFEFESNDAEFYCSELVNTCFKLAGYEPIKKNSQILPSDFSNYPVVYSSVVKKRR